MRVRKARKLIKRWAYARSRDEMIEVNEILHHLLLRAARTIWTRRTRMKKGTPYQGLGPRAEVMILYLNAEMGLRRTERFYRTRKGPGSL